MTDRKTLISIAQAAELCAVSTKTIRRHIAGGTIPAYRLGPRIIRVDQNELDAALRRIPTAATER